eukprot:2651216-Lingulodinium_polyedra.AAC.1
MQRLTGAIHAWMGGSLPKGNGYPSLTEIEVGYQALRQSLDPSLRTMPWTAPADVLEAARGAWRDPGGPA